MHLSLERLNRRMERVMALLAWVLIGVGAITLLITVPMLYFLATGEVRPGEPYFLEGLAPHRSQLVSAAGMGLASLAIGLSFRAMVRKPARRAGDSD
jgi:hypothetical protein